VIDGANPSKLRLDAKAEEEQDPYVRTRARARWTIAATVVVGVTACAGDPAGHDGFVTVAGGQLDVRCDGGAGPTVIFVSAIGGDNSLEPIAERLRDEAYVCLYDRPGDGETQPPESPRTAAGDAADLHELIGAIDIPAPVVLVAHSYGGLISVIAAATHPDEIGGMVLIDASHPEQEERTNILLTDQQRAVVAGEFANFPHVDFATSLDEAAEAFDSFPEMPLTVITATRGHEPGCDLGLPCDEMQAVWLEVQTEYAALTPDARHVRADTGHYVHDDDPDLVTREIQALLDRTTPAEGG
jgi:pimeloyl-ACP methyl ester carboxylesterase